MTGTEILVTAAGVALVGTLAYFFFGPKEARRAEVRGGVQEIEITVKGGYSPNLIRVQEGVPLRLVFDRQENSDCSSRVVFADYGVSKSLAAFGRTTVELMPTKVGEYGFACGMNMLHGTLVVEAGNGNGSVSATPETMAAQDVATAAAVQGDASHTHEVARAVGVGPVREAKGTSLVEFGLRGGGVTCPTCVRNIEGVLDRMSGVDDVQVNFGAERLAPWRDRCDLGSDARGPRPGAPGDHPLSRALLPTRCPGAVTPSRRLARRPVRVRAIRAAEAEPAPTIGLACDARSENRWRPACRRFPCAASASHLPPLQETSTGLKLVGRG